MQDDGNLVREIELTINSCKIFQTAVIPAIIKHCTEMQNLDVRLSTSALATGADSLNSTLECCTKLKVTFSHSGNHEAALAEALKHCHNLRTLDLSREVKRYFSGEGITAASMKKLAVCRH